jgi:hypothetical protein
MLGLKEANASASPTAMVWQQDSTAFASSDSFQPAQMVPMSIGGVQLPGSLTLQHAR